MRENAWLGRGRYLGVLSCRTKPAATETLSRYKDSPSYLKIDGRPVINQPAGHVDPGEDLRTAVIREAREETAWQFWTKR